MVSAVLTAKKSEKEYDLSSNNIVKSVLTKVILKISICSSVTCQSVKVASRASEVSSISTV